MVYQWAWKPCAASTEISSHIPRKEGAGEKGSEEDTERMPARVWAELSFLVLDSGPLSEDSTCPACS